MDEHLTACGMFQVCGVARSFFTTPGLSPVAASVRNICSSAQKVDGATLGLYQIYQNYSITISRIKILHHLERQNMGHVLVTNSGSSSKRSKHHRATNCHMTYIYFAWHKSTRRSHATPKHVLRFAFCHLRNHEMFLPFDPIGSCFAFFFSLLSDFGASACLAIACAMTCCPNSFPAIGWTEIMRVSQGINIINIHKLI